MALNIWTQRSGYNFGIFQERTTISQPLPVIPNTGATFTIIAGELPPGLRIVDEHITGTPFEVPRMTTFTFCIRATKDNQISDRTYEIDIDGADAPVFVTPSGALAVIQPKQFYVLDNSFVDYQLEAYDFDTATGQVLSYFIDEEEGVLPPGLSLTQSGKITGYVTPVYSIKPSDGSGSYDLGYFDTVGYDFAVRPSNGYDSFDFDDTNYDYNLPDSPPKKLNRNYGFTVTLTDGDTIAKRKFSIFVVGDDYFRADNTTLLDDNTLFSSDVTYLHPPVWISNSNLGTFRANNYITLDLKVYNKTDLYFQYEEINADILAIAIKKTSADNKITSNRLTLKSKTAPEVGQYLSFERQLVVNTWSQLTIYNVGDLVNYDNNIYECLVKHKSPFNPDGFLAELDSGVWQLYPSNEKYKIIGVESLGNTEYRLTLNTTLKLNVPDETIFYIGYLSVLPPGLKFNQLDVRLYGKVPYQPAITKTFTFTVSATKYGNHNDRSVNMKTFTITLIGEIDSVLSWITTSDLGTIHADFDSTLMVKASSTALNAILSYSVVDGYLPAGLSLQQDGEIIGKVYHFGDKIIYRALWHASRLYQINDVVTYNGIKYIRTVIQNNIEQSFDLLKWSVYKSTRSGLTSFDYSLTQMSFDTENTSIDRLYTFTIQASDQYQLSQINRTFTVKITPTNDISYSNISVRPYLVAKQRAMWSDFINDPSIFTPENIYRPSDPAFGIQTDLSMLIYAGIETVSTEKFISATGLNHKRKRFQFGSVKKAIAYVPDTYTPVYEIIYVEMLDPLEPNNKRLPTQIKHLGTQSKSITVDNSKSIWGRRIDELSADIPNATRPDPIITVDNTGYQASNAKPNTYYPNSISNWQDRIKSVGVTERNYLPLWMRSIQPGTRQQPGYTMAVPLCYCKIGMADDIILNIKHSDFDFKLLDYSVDRYIMDSSDGFVVDKYIIFKNDRITIG